MNFEWDATKSERNRVERDLPFAVAMELFKADFIDDVDVRHDYGKERRLAIGVARGLILVRIYTDRGNRCRIVSLRRANTGECRAYRARFK
jgi:uncharacterized DUF497 family protein